AHGELMTFGAYMAFVVNVLWAADIFWGLVFAVATTAGIAMAMELLVFRKLAGKGPVPALVASIGITIFLQNLVNLTFGTSIQILLFVFAAVIVGGLGSPYGAMLGGLIVGIAQALATAFLGWLGRPSVIGLQHPTTYSPIAAFLIMILVLLLRPGGLVSGKM